MIELPKIRQIIYKVVPPQVSSFVHLRTIGIISKNLTVNLVISQFGKQKNGHSQHFTVLRSSPPRGSCLLLWIQPFQPLVGDVISSFFWTIGSMYGIYANKKGVYWWDPCYHIAYMDPMGSIICGLWNLPFLSFPRQLWYFNMPCLCFGYGFWHPKQSSQPTSALS